MTLREKRSKRARKAYERRLRMQWTRAYCRVYGAATWLRKVPTGCGFGETTWGMCRRLASLGLHCDERPLRAAGAVAIVAS